MQIASFILVNDRLFKRFEEQLDTVMRQVTSPQMAFGNLVTMQLQQLGDEHPISIPFSTLFPLDQAAGRQHLMLLSAFEDPTHPSRLSKMAESVNAPIYYVSPARVKEFARALEHLRLTTQVRTEDVETLLGKRVSSMELPNAVRLLEEFRHDLYQVYHDAAENGMGVVVVIVNQPDEMTSEETFPKAA